jgi:hypothetical protein
MVRFYNPYPEKRKTHGISWFSCFLTGQRTQALAYIDETGIFFAGTKDFFSTFMAD